MYIIIYKHFFKYIYKKTLMSIKNGTLCKKYE